MFEKTRMHSFQCDVFAAVAVIDAKTDIHRWERRQGRQRERLVLERARQDSLG